MGLMDANPAGFQNFVFGELLSDPQVLKVGMPDDAGCKPLPSQGKSSEYEFSPNCGSLHSLGFMARLCLSLSYPLYCGFPFVYLMRRDCLSVFRVSLGASQVAQW